MIRPLCAIAMTLSLLACQRAPAPDAAATPDAGAAPAADASKAADPARPSLSIRDIEGRTLDLAAERGRWVVVNFWATWCGPCIKEMPELDALDARRDDLRVFGLAYEEIEPADLRAFLAKRPVGYPIAIVDVFSPPPGFETPRVLPATHLVAPDGRLAKSFAGPVTAADIEAVIAAHGRG